MKIIAIANQKGGVGKTTTATALAYGLVQKGKRVLLIDSDPQGNSSDTWGADLSDGAPSLSDLLFSEEPELNCIQHTPVGDILAGDAVLEDAEKHLTGFRGFFRLKNRLTPLLPHYDHIIIDTPPNLGILLQNALIAADGVIVPITSSRYALKGMGRFTASVEDVRSQPNPDLKVLGLLLVRYDGRTMLARDVAAGLPSLAEQLGTEVFDTKIRRTEEVEKAQASFSPLQLFSPNATAAVDYTHLIGELEKRGIV